MGKVSIPLWFSRNSFYYKNYTRLAEAKSNLSSSFVRKTLRVRIRVSLVSEILYFVTTLALRSLVFYKSFDLFSVVSLLTDLESFKIRLRSNDNGSGRRRSYTIDPTKEYEGNVNRATSIQ